MDKACIYLAQKLIIKCNLANLTVYRLEDIGGQFLSLLFNKICVPFIEDPPLLPSSDDEIGLIRAILDSLSCDFLNYDLSARVSAEAIRSKNIDALLFILEIFDNLCDCLLEEKPIRTAVKRRDVVPIHLRAKLRACGKKSALYSPRTAFFRRPNDVLTSKTETKIIPRDLQPCDVSLLKKFGISGDDLNLLQIENLIHRAKFQSLLNRLRKEHEKNENDIKMRTAKVILTKAIRHHINRANDRKLQNCTHKSAKLTFENVLKDRKRDEILSKRAKNESEPKFSDEPTRLLHQFKTADCEAQKFFADFVRRQTEDESNAVDSVENFARDRINQIID